MEESILISIKKLLGIDKDYTAFDTDIIIHINSVFMILHQLGVGTYECYKIQDDLNTWKEFITDADRLDAVKSYIYHKVKSLFDPPTSPAVAEANKQVTKELEWRLNVQAES